MNRSTPGRLETWLCDERLSSQATSLDELQKQHHTCRATTATTARTVGAPFHHHWNRSAVKTRVMTAVSAGYVPRCAVNRRRTLIFHPNTGTFDSRGKHWVFDCQGPGYRNEIDRGYMSLCHPCGVVAACNGAGL